MKNVKVIMLAYDQLGQVKAKSKDENERMVSIPSLCKFVLAPALLSLPTLCARVKIEFFLGPPT